jgi:chromosome segregation ATPase
MKLDKIYINEAIRIRQEYMTSLKNILGEEDNIAEKKKQVDNYQNNMEKIIQEDMHDITKRLKLNNDLQKIERLINGIQDNIRPHYDNIEKLRGDADKLYNSITEKYPNVDTEEIQKQIAPYLQFK